MKKYELKTAFILSEKIHKEAQKLMDNLGNYNPGRTLEQAKLVSLSELRQDAAVMCSQLQKLRDLTC